MNSNNHTSQIIESDPTVIQAELQRVLGERRFSGAPQMSAFLRYIVTETLNGHADRIKAFSVGVDALGKPDTFDAQTDPSVRVLALRLRKTLAAMYEQQDDCLAVIQLQVGTYVPNFYKPVKSNGTATAASESTPAATASAPPVQKARESRIPPSKSHEPVTAQAVRMEKPAYSGVQTERQESHPAHAVRRTSEGVSLNGMLSSKIAIFGGAILLAAVWQASVNGGAREGVSGTMASVGLPVMSASSGTWQSADNAASVATTLPTIYMDAVSGSQALERRVVMMLSSRLANSGAVNVVDASAASHTPREAGAYQLMISGYTVESDARIIAQLVRLGDGELLFTDTLLLGSSSDSFTTQGIGAIDAMAGDIVSVEGPLFDDFCITFSEAEQDCPVS